MACSHGWRLVGAASYWAYWNEDPQGVRNSLIVSVPFITYSSLACINWGVNQETER